eukprot:3608260-Alexandrium_andersonii.AAC.2
MSASLVGSEMCIRDRESWLQQGPRPPCPSTPPDTPSIGRDLGAERTAQPGPYCLARSSLYSLAGPTFHRLYVESKALSARSPLPAR